MTLPLNFVFLFQFMLRWDWRSVAVVPVCENAVAIANIALSERFDKGRAPTHSRPAGQLGRIKAETVLIVERGDRSISQAADAFDPDVKRRELKVMPTTAVSSAARTRDTTADTLGVGM
jgi:hypothetical protein